MNHSRSVRGIYDDRNEARWLFAARLREGSFPQEIWLFHCDAKPQARGPGRNVVMEVIAPMPVALLHAASVHRVEAGRAKPIGLPRGSKVRVKGLKAVCIDHEFCAGFANVAQSVTPEACAVKRRLQRSIKRDVIERYIECGAKNGPALGPMSPTIARSVR